MPAVSMKRKAASVVFDNFVDCVPRRPRDGRDDGTVRGSQTIQQSGLANVGMADDSDLGFVDRFSFGG